MQSLATTENTFLERLKREVEANLTNEQFGVEALSRNMGMSRSQLHRKLNTVTGQSVSRFIREFRLERAMELLTTAELTAAEVADMVGFGSASYFSKCFSEYYGVPPGEAKSRAGLAHNDHAPHRRTSPGQHRPVGISRLLLAGILLLAVSAALYFYWRNGEEGAVSGKSIAILPFRNLSDDPGNRYFSQGIVEAIRTRLSQVGDLRVISSTTVEQYRNSSKPARTIAKELGVAALLEGTIQRNDEEVKIEVRLVDGETEALVWAKGYQRTLKDVFAIQREIALEVAHELNAKLSAAEESRLSKNDTDNVEAYDLYLKGVYAYRTYTNAGAHRAIALLSRAIALDSNYARAYAFLANSHIGLATIWGAEYGAIEALRKGKPFIDKALALDPGLDEAHMLLAFYKLYHDWDFEGAEAEYLRAIRNDHPDALALYVDYLNFMSRHEEAMRYAAHLDKKYPYYPNSRMILSYIYNDRLAEALAFSESRLKMFSNYYTFDAHGFLLLNLKRYEEAIRYFERAMALEGIRYPRMLGWMGAAYARSGERATARRIITELKDRLTRDDKASISFFIAVIYGALEDEASTLHWLNAAYRAHDMEMPWLMTEPQFFFLHDEPEFRVLEQRMGFN